MRIMSPGMFGLDEEDFNEGFSCFPLERMMGVDGVRGSEEALEGDGIRGEFLNFAVNVFGDGSGDDVGNGTGADDDDPTVICGAVIGGMSMWDGGSTEGEKRPVSFANLRELSGGYAPAVKRGAARAGEAAEVAASSWSFWSSGGESSGLRWKTALFVAEGRRLGRAPREAKAPGPVSSLKEERVRRCCGRVGVSVDVEVEEEEEDAEGTGACTGTAYGILTEGAWMERKGGRGGRKET